MTHTYEVGSNAQASEVEQVDPHHIFFQTLIRMKMLHMVAFLLAMVGALNWGLVGLGGFMGSDLNIVHMILGSMAQLEWLVYVLVGLSAVWLIVMHKGDCKHCSAGGRM